MKELLRDAVSVIETWGARFPDGMSASDRAVLTRIQAEIDAPEPYDQQALEPCEVCGWKTIMPGEPCLMCERNAKMLEPEKEPFGWYSAKNDEFMLHLRKTEHERLGSYTSKVGGFDAPLYTRPQQTNYYPLPTSLYQGSKDWAQGDYAERVEWLHSMYENQREQTEMYVKMSQSVADLTDEELKMLAKSVYGSCNYTQDLAFARAVLAAQRAKR